MNIFNVTSQHTLIITTQMLIHRTFLCLYRQLKSAASEWERWCTFDSETAHWGQSLFSFTERKTWKQTDSFDIGWSQAVSLPPVTTDIIQADWDVDLSALTSRPGPGSVQSVGCIDLPPGLTECPPFALLMELLLSVLGTKKAKHYRRNRCLPYLWVRVGFRRLWSLGSGNCKSH